MSESWPFLKPVNKKQVKDYYSKIKHPMDLEQISKKVTGNFSLFVVPGVACQFHFLTFLIH